MSDLIFFNFNAMFLWQTMDQQAQTNRSRRIPWLIIIIASSIVIAVIYFITRSLQNTQSKTQPSDDPNINQELLPVNQDGTCPAGLEAVDGNCFVPCRQGFTAVTFVSPDGVKSYHCRATCGAGTQDQGATCVRPTSMRELDTNIRCTGKNQKPKDGVCVVKDSIANNAVCLTPGSTWVAGANLGRSCFKPCPAGTIPRKDETNRMCVLPCPPNTRDSGGNEPNLCYKQAYLRTIT